MISLAALPLFRKLQVQQIFGRNFCDIFFRPEFGHNLSKIPTYLPLPAQRIHAAHELGMDQLGEAGNDSYLRIFRKSVVHYVRIAGKHWIGKNNEQNGNLAELKSIRLSRSVTGCFLPFKRKGLIRYTIMAVPVHKRFYVNPY